MLGNRHVPTEVRGGHRPAEAPRKSQSARDTVRDANWRQPALAKVVIEGSTETADA